MERILRRHILSEYAFIGEPPIITKATLDKVSMEVSNEDEVISYVVGPTRLTESVETSDPDEFIMSGPTRITKTIEVSDPDGFVMVSPTYLTHAEEESDQNEYRKRGETNAVDAFDLVEIKMEPTKNTYTVETSDEDEFLLM